MQQTLLELIEAALNSEAPNHAQAVQQINYLMEECDVELLRMGLYAAIAENAPPFFKNEAALLVKNFLTCKNPQKQMQSIQVYEALPLEFRNATISQLILLISSSPYDQIFEILAALINSSTAAEQAQIVEELIKHASIACTFEILRVFEELRSTAFTQSIPEFCVHCLEHFEQLFAAEQFEEGIKLSVKVLRRCKAYIPEALHEKINQILYLLLQQSVKSQHTEFIQEILEFYVEVVELFDLLSFTVDSEAFITELLNLCFMYSAPRMQEYQMLFTILELEKKVFSLPMYISIYQSQYPFSTVENCLLPILSNDAYYGEQMLSELYVVMQELLDIIIQHTDKTFQTQYLQYVNSMGLNCLASGEERVLQVSEQLGLLRHLILLTPLLKSGKDLDHFFIEQMECAALCALEYAAQVSGQLLEEVLDMSCFLLGKCKSRYDLFNRIVDLLPALTKDFHWRSIKGVLIEFEAIDPRYMENNLTRIYSHAIKGKNTIDTAAAMVLIDQVLPVLEKSIAQSNLFFFMSTVNGIFQQIQQYFMQTMDIQEIPYLQVVTESLNIPVFFIVCQEMHLTNEEAQLFNNIACRVSDLLIFYVNQNRFEIENELCQLFEIISIIEKKTDYRLHCTPTLNKVCLELVCDAEETDITSYCLDLLVKLPEFISNDEIEERVIDIITRPETPYKLQNAVLLYFMELEDVYQKQLPPPIITYIDSFLYQIDTFDFSDKQQFLVLESIVLSLQKTVEIFCTAQDQAVFAAYEMLKNSKSRPSLTDEPEEYLFVSGYEAAINCFTCCYHQFKQSCNQTKEQMVLGYVNELGKEWARIREILRQLNDMQQHLSEFECEFSAILRQNQ